MTGSSPGHAPTHHPRLRPPRARPPRRGTTTRKSPGPSRSRRPHRLGTRLPRPPRLRSAELPGSSPTPLPALGRLRGIPSRCPAHRERPAHARPLPHQGRRLLRCSRTRQHRPRIAKAATRGPRGTLLLARHLPPPDQSAHPGPGTVRYLLRQSPARPHPALRSLPPLRLRLPPRQRPRRSRRIPLGPDPQTPQ
jgi:hypothetical protein